MRCAGFLFVLLLSFSDSFKVLRRATQRIWYVGSFMSADYLLLFHLFAWIASFSRPYFKQHILAFVVVVVATIGFLACNSTVLKLHLKWYRTHAFVCYQYAWCA